MGFFDRLFGKKKKEGEGGEPRGGRGTGTSTGAGAREAAFPFDGDEAAGGGDDPVRDAEEILRELSRAEIPMDQEALEAAVSTLVGAGHELRAIDLLRRVSAGRGDPPDVAHRVALLLLARGDDESALPLLECAAGEPSLAADALFRLAEVHERAERPARALESYELVLARDFDFPNARERALRLRKAVAPVAPSAAPTLFSPEGARVQGRFRLLRELGRGGAGAVYLAEDARLGRNVALKVYHPARSGDADPNRRLLHEASVAAAIRHPGVIRILDVIPDLRAIVMEELAGSFKERTRAGVGTDDALALLGGALDVLAVVHACGIVHRDVKPSNFLLRDDGRVVLTDFGVALVGETDAEKGVVGTAGYLAPEVAAGGRAKPAADVYAMGVIASEVLGNGAGDARSEVLRELALAMRAPDPSARPDSATALRRVRALLGEAA